MFKAISNIAIAKVVPELVDYAIQSVKDFFSEDSKKQPTVVAPRKKYDTRKFTKNDYDVIVDGFSELEEHNLCASPGNRKTTQDLTDKLNEVLGLHKSASSYSRVWTGKVQREDLPDQR